MIFLTSTLKTMKYIYTLRIHTIPSFFGKLDELLKVKGIANHGWTYQVEENQDDEPYDFISEFIKILDCKESNLLELGISPEEIEFWMLYEYEGQCNMEFNPEQMKRLGEKGYSLCISCYESEPFVGS